jgi:hypothetical protein
MSKKTGTGISEGGFDNQLLFTDFDGSFNLSVISHKSTGNFGVSFLSTGLFTDQLRMDDDPSLTSDSHTVQAQHEASLPGGQHTILGYAIVNEHVSFHSEIADGGAAIDGLAIPISIADFDVRRDLASQGSDGTITDLEVLKLEGLSLQPFQALPFFGSEGDGFIRPRLFAGVTPGLGQSDNQNNQRALQHNLSFGSQTLPPDRKSVKRSDLFSTLLLAHPPPHLSRFTSHVSRFAV